MGEGVRAETLEDGSQVCVWVGGWGMSKPSWFPKLPAH